MTFASLGLPDELLQALTELGYQAPTPVQAQAIPAVLDGRDLMAAAQTGTGKTAGFALPLIARLMADTTPVASNAIRALVLVPTRELAEQVNESFRAYAQHTKVKSFAAYGGVSLNPQMMRLRRGVDILVATPGRLLDLFHQNAVKFKQVRTLVLDEADRMLDLGFARELNQVFSALPRGRQTLLFSATFSDDIRALAGQMLHNPLSIEVTPRNTAAKTVEQWVVPVDKKKKPALFVRMLKDRRWGQVLVFVKTKRGVDELVDALLAKGLKAESIHGDKPQPARLRALASFKANEVQILVATDVAARGLDIDDLPIVVNFDLPIVAEDYIHRIGRTGRAGATGEAVSLVCADEVGLLAAIETLLGKVLPREEEPGFEPDHRVPVTAPGGQVTKKPKKPKQPKAAAPAAPGSRRTPRSGSGIKRPPKLAPKAAPKTVPKAPRKPR